MKKLQSKVILELTLKMKLIFGVESTQALEVNRKEDYSLVTEIDLFVSNLIKNELLKIEKYRTFHFFSEEEYDDLLFPAAILDPIDGTRELVKGIPECAVSLGLMNSADLRDPENFGWIFNPFTGFSIDNSLPCLQSKFVLKKKILGMVSRSEFEKGYFDKFLSNESAVEITPRGSIAFKLGLLAAGGCDFVLSLSPKNIWDIAAGTILCQKRDIFLYQNGKIITDLDNIRIDGVLIWAPAELAEDLWKKFKKEKNS